MKHYVSSSSYTVSPGLLCLLLVVLLIKLPQGDLHYVFHQTFCDILLALTAFHFSQKRQHQMAQFELDRKSKVFCWQLKTGLAHLSCMFILELNWRISSIVILRPVQTS